MSLTHRTALGQRKCPYSVCPMTSILLYRIVHTNQITSS